ncbi:MAG: CoA transferase [Chloroflexi bacterium]|nr:CoA transferase [Chloroflexota bacterium]
MRKLPLEGVRVLGMTVIFAGPYAEMFLADYGAEVIRVESIQNFAPSTRGQYVRPPKGAAGYPNGDPGERPWNRFATFNSMARNKLGMTIDITRPEGMEIFKQLVRASDVFISNYVPSVLDRLGITYEMLKKEKPDIIYARISGYGDTGPYRDYRAQANGIDAIGGQASTRGYRHADPSELPGSSAADPAEGVAAVFAIVSALNYRDRTGKGQLIDMALVENFITYNPEPFLDYSMNGRVQGTLGNRDPIAVPSGNFRCEGDDNWVSICIFGDEQWEGFCKVVGEGWVHDPRFKDPLSRRKHEDELEKLVESWTKRHDYYEVMHLLQKVGVPAGPVLDEAAVFQDPHLKARGIFVEVSQKDTGTYLYPGALAKMRNAPLVVRHAPVRLGEDNDYVYKEVLGIGDDEYQKLAETGHIGMDYAVGVR